MSVEYLSVELTWMIVIHHYIHTRKQKILSGGWTLETFLMMGCPGLSLLGSLALAEAAGPCFSHMGLVSCASVYRVQLSPDGLYLVVVAAVEINEAVLLEWSVLWVLWLSCWNVISESCGWCFGI